MEHEKIESILDSIDDRTFEYFIGDLFESYGWKTRVTQQSGDLGVDVIARQKKAVDLKLLIQAKNYSKRNKVARSEVQQYAGLYLHENNVSNVVIVTTSTFGASAEKVADEADVELIDRDKLIKLIINSESDFLTEYTDRDIELSESTGESNSHSPGLESEIKIQTVDPEVPLALSLLGIAEIDVNVISTEFSTDQEYRLCVFLEIHNGTDAQWIYTPNSISMVDSSGYIHEPDWVGINSDNLPPKWGIGRWALEPDDRIRTMMIFPTLDQNEKFGELRYERRIYKAAKKGSELERKYRHSNVDQSDSTIIKQSINPSESELNDLRDVSFTLSSGQTITK